MLQTPFGSFDTRRIFENRPLAPFTSWRVGGPARWLLEPVPLELPEISRRCRDAGVPIYVLGRGSNVLIPDAGLPGLVLLMRSMRGFEVKEDRIACLAGTSLPALARAAADMGCPGFEFLIGIPGTVGGGVAMNCGTTWEGVCEVGPLLVDADVVDLATSNPVTLSPSDLTFAHRSSKLLNSSLVLTKATFRLEERVPKKVIEGTMRRYLRERRRKQPLQAATAGSTFKQVQGGSPAGWYLEQCGLKGVAIGGARVSEKHANWIENQGKTASSADIRALIDLMREQVSRRFGVQLELEVQMMGF